MYMTHLNSNIILESKQRPINEGLQYHIDTDTPISKNVYRRGTNNYFELFNEARKLYNEGVLSVTNEDDIFFLESDIGKTGIYEGKRVVLDFPIQINEKTGEYEGEEVELESPKRGGDKKYYVYVKNPDSGQVNKVEFGAEDGGQDLAVKLDDKEARQAFAARHNCDEKDDKLSAGYWSCNLPKYADELGLEGGGDFYW